MAKRLKLNFALSNCLFRVVELINNAAPDKYRYGGYDNRLDARSQFSWTHKSWG